MNTLVLFLIILGGVLYVAMPFIRKKTDVEGGTVNGNGLLDDLYARRDNLLTAIKDVEFDREMGKISERDFAETNERYRREAMDVLKDIDSLESGDGAAQRLEEELLALRQERKKRGMAFCPTCATPVGPKDRFCSQCGYRLQRDSL